MVRRVAAGRRVGQSVLVGIATLVASGLCGCAHVEGRTVLLQGASVGERISPDRVQVIAVQADSDRFERIAQLQYRTDGDNFDGAAERVLIDRLKEEAAALGADTLLDLRIVVEEDGVETTVTEQTYGDINPSDRDRRWGTTTTTARIRSGPAFRTVATAVAARRR